MRRNHLLLGAAYLLLITTTSLAQTKHILDFQFDTVPHNITITRDCSLRLSGALDLGVSDNFYMMCRDKVRQSGRAAGSLNYTWDPASESGDRFSISIWRGYPEAGHSQLLRIYINVVEKAPVEITVPRDVCGITPITVISGAGQIPLVDFELDGVTMPSTGGVAGRQVWDASLVRPGNHVIRAKAHLGDGSIYFAEPSKVSVRSAIQPVLFTTDGNIDLGAINGDIELHARIEPGIKLKSIKYEIDGFACGKRDTLPFDTCFWNPAGIGVGAHSFRLSAVNTDGLPITSDVVPFTITGKQALGTTTESAKPVPLHNGTTSTGIPSFVFQCEKLPRSILSTPESRLIINGVIASDKDAEVFINDGGKELDKVRSHGDFTLSVLPGLQPGLHALEIHMRLLDGTEHTFAKSDLTVVKTVPVAIGRITSERYPLGPVVLSASDSAGREMSRARFYKDGSLILHSSDTPLAVVWDPRAEHPGDYSFYAAVEAKDGTTILTQPLVFHVPIRIGLADLPTVFSVTAQNRTLSVRARAILRVHIGGDGTNLQRVHRDLLRA